jgi:hypothetical protein
MSDYRCSGLELTATLSYCFRNSNFEQQTSNLTCSLKIGPIWVKRFLWLSSWRTTISIHTEWGRNRTQHSVNTWVLGTEHNILWTTEWYEQNATFCDHLSVGNRTQHSVNNWMVWTEHNILWTTEWYEKNTSFCEHLSVGNRTQHSVNNWVVWREHIILWTTEWYEQNRTQHNILWTAEWYD